VSRTSKIGSLPGRESSSLVIFLQIFRQIHKTRHSAAKLISVRFRSLVSAFCRKEGEYPWV
ncbi:MAG: hypothetical protein SPC23_10110, partial [Lachnospiraceae bacterium]|nr:hypothetical protein [Lachnospiraceae bacterium]